ncbi:hypothetical protein VPH35_090469 [Triticum aestivum]
MAEPRSSCLHQDPAFVVSFCQVPRHTAPERPPQQRQVPPPMTVLDSPSPTTKRIPCTTTVPWILSSTLPIGQVRLHGYDNFVSEHVQLSSPCTTTFTSVARTTTSTTARVPLLPSSNSTHSKMHALKFRLCCDVRIRSTKLGVSSSVRPLHGLGLFPSGISVAGADDTSAGDATKLKWEFDEDLVRYYVSFPDDQ